MILNKKQILATRDSRTETVDVPEWGEGSQVLVGIIGGLATVRLQDWLQSLGRQPDGEAERMSARVGQLTASLKGLVAAARASVEKPQDVASAIEEAEQLLDDDDPQKIFNREDDYQFCLRWCAEAIIDQGTGRPMFALAEIEELGDLDRAPILRIADAAQRLNAATRKARRDAEKNSGTQAGSSGSDSPCTVDTPTTN